MEEQKQKTEEKKEEMGAKSEESTKEIHHHHWHEHRGFNLGRFLFGLAVVVIGLAYLAKTTGWMNFNIDINWANLWPLIIILIGLSLVSFRGWLGAIFGIIIALAVLALASFLIFGSANSSFTSSGNVITEQRNVEGFNGISFSGIGNLIIDQGDKESLKIEAEDNVLPRIKTKVDDKVLKIDYAWNWPWFSFRPQKPINFYITVRDINQINLSGLGLIKSSGLKSNQLKIGISGAGKTELSVDVQKLTLEISGAGDSVIFGKTDTQNVEVSGAGKYDGKALESKEADIEISGAGNAIVRVSDKLNAEVSGGGNVSYIGNPQVSQKISGAGKINKLSE